MNTFIVGSSHGELICDQDGNVVTCECDNCNDRCIDNIAKVDVEEFRRTYGYPPHEAPDGYVDILDVGVWDKDGTYGPPEEDWRKEMRLPFINQDEE